MIYHNNIKFRDFYYNEILFKPIEEGANKLKIISGYASPAMASWHITEIAEQEKPPIEISLIVGMCSNDGLSIITHEGFKNLMNNSRIITNNKSSFTCQYVVEGAPVHSKLYIWERDEKPFKVYLGSANYSQIAFSNRRREILCECSSFEALSALEYFNAIEANSMYCNHTDIEEFIQISRTPRYNFGDDIVVNTPNTNTLKLSLLDYKGNIHERSGLNWGQRPGRNLNQAYIPLPVEKARSGFFPLDKRHFNVLTDDNKNLILRVEQQNNKAITTPLNNSHIGEYFRNRLGLCNGAFVTKQDLLNYGRTDVEFFKIDDEQYFMNFSNT
jgi:NgoFVII restriction endonuclease.